MDQKQTVHELLYEYLLALKIDLREFEKFSATSLGTNIFTLPNQAAFQFITHFLFNKLDSSKCAENFRYIWPPLNKKHAADFNKVASNWLSTLHLDNPASRIPKVSVALLMSPYGEKLCALYLAFARFVLQNSLKRRNSIKILKNPCPSFQNRSVALNAHVAMCQNFIFQQEEVERMSLNIRKRLSECATALVNNNHDLKSGIKDTESQLNSTNQEICDMFGQENVSDAESKLDDLNRELLQTVRNSWQQIESLHQAILPSKKILESDFSSIDKILLDGSKYLPKMPPLLIQEIRPKLEKENLFKIHEKGNLIFEKLVRFSSIVLLTFDEPLKELSGKLHVERILSEQKSLEQEVEKVIENLKRENEKVITSSSLFLKEYESQLSTFDNSNKPKPYTINGRRYSLQQTTPKANLTVLTENDLDISANTSLMNLSSANWRESSDSDATSSPEFRRMFSKRFVVGPQHMTFEEPRFEETAKNMPELPKLKADKSHFKKPARKSWSNDKLTLNNNNNTHLLSCEKSKNASVCTPTERRHFSFDGVSCPVKFEDLVLSPSLNNPYAASMMSNDSLNFSLLDAQTLPECPEFDITTELESSNFLLELSD